MSHRPSELKARLLAAVIFLPFLLDLGEFVAWKVERVLGPWLHR